MLIHTFNNVNKLMKQFQQVNNHVGFPQLTYSIVLSAYMSPKRALTSKQ